MAGKVVSACLFFMLLPGIAMFAGPASCSELPEITAELDSAEEPAEFARLAAKLSMLVTGLGEEDTATRARALTQLARAYYLLGEAECVEDRRLKYLNSSLDASDRALKAEPENPRATYWRSMAFLQKADIVSGLSALGMVKSALKGFERVESTDASYDGAGAYRSHGKVLMEAPAWAFIGDKDRGVELLEKAKATEPCSLLNRLYLAEAYAQTGRQDEARAELEYIMAARANKHKPKEDADIKKDAAALLDELGR